MRWKLSGMPALAAAAQRRSQARSAMSIPNTSTIAPRCPSRRAALQLRDRRVRRVCRDEREDAQPVGRDHVELLDRPVVPRRVAVVLQARVVDREPERERSVDHRRREPVAVHVLQAQLRGARPVPVVLDPGAADGAEAPEQRAVAWVAAAAEHAVLAHPHPVAVALDHVRPAGRVGTREARGPEVGRDRPQVEVVVARVDPDRRLHRVPPDR